MIGGVLTVVQRGQAFRAGALLYLDLLNSTSLDNRITFSRTSQATLVDSTGKLTYAPNNILPNSQDFEASSWTKTSATVTANSAVAPDGTTTADTITAASGSVSPIVFQNTAAGTSPVVISFYAKAGTYGLVQISTDYGVGFYANFDLNNGVVGSKGASCTDSNITAVGNGWYRISAAFGFHDNPVIGLVGSTTATKQQAFTAAGTETVYIWGAQLEQVTYQTTPGTYNSTSPKNLLGYTQEFDNAAWTKSNAFVQTNLLTYSQEFDNAAWAKGAAGTGIAPVVTANAATAPDGTTTADLVVFDRGAGNALADRSTLSQAPTVANATAYSHSIYLKAATAGDVGKQIAFRGVAGGGYQVVTLTSSWVRVNITETSISTTGNFELATRGTITTSNQVSVHLWGAQLVQGSTAGDYQRTDAAAAAVQYVAPDGSRTADKLVETTVNGGHYVLQSITALAIPYTFSAYVKAAERTFAMIYNAQTNAGQVINLATGALAGNAGLSAPTSSSVTDVGNGWYLLSMTITATAASNNFRIYAMSDATTFNYAGDGTSGIYIWGAQLSNSASLDPYVYNPVAAPTSAAYYGPRFDYDPVTLANKGLLIEEQRTNLLLRSEEFDNAGAWAKSNVSVTANAIVSPDGTTNADLLLPDTVTGSHQVAGSATTTATATTFSVYAKAGGYNWIALAFSDSGAVLRVNYFNVSTGVVGTVATGVTASITPIGNGWYRCVATIGTALAGSNTCRIYATNADGATSFAGNGTSGIYIWGAQLEAGSFATSYIPTVASQVTRTADVALMQGANFSNWYNQNEGAIYAEFDQYSITSPNNQWAVFASDGTANNYLGSMTNPSSYRGLVVVGGSTQASIINGTVSANTLIKSMLAYKANDFAATSNGLAVGTDTSGSVPVVNSLTLGSGGGSAYLNGHIRRIGYYPTRLANAQLQSLTAQSTIPSLSLDFTTQVFNVG